MQESAGALGVQLVRSRKKMKATVSETTKRTQLESKRAAAAFFILAENKDTDEANKFFDAERKDVFNMGMSDINATTPAAVASREVAVRGASAWAMSGTAAEASSAAAASAVAFAGGGNDADIASGDDSDSTTNMTYVFGRDKRGSVESFRTARGRRAMAEKNRAEEERMNKAQAAIDLTGPDMGVASSVTAPAPRGGTRSRSVEDIAQALGTVSARTGCAVDKDVTNDEAEE